MKNLSKDRKRVSNEDHELDYFKRRWGVGRTVVREAKNAVGVSRRKIMAWLILHDKIDEGYLTDFDNIVL